jgi:hypothetical protein
MKYIILFLVCHNAVANDMTNIKRLSEVNGFHPTAKVLQAILNASVRYSIDPKELTAIGILETGLGKYVKERLNPNGSVDRGIFQVNTVNLSHCIEYNLNSIEGNAFCAAKLLHFIARRHRDYLGRYHSKTPKHKIAYQKAALRVLSAQALNVD